MIKLGIVTLAAITMGCLPALSSATRPAVKAFAQVSADGSIINKSDHVTATRRLDTGLYQVTFDIRVSQCAWFAQIVYPDTPSGGGAQAGHSDSAKKILIRTGSGGGGPFDSEFHLAVIC